MPIYEYSCRKCGATLEVMQKITDEPLKRHAKCGGKLEKQLSAPALQFKGSGWYITDYARGKSDAKEDGKEKKAEAGETKSGEPAAGDGASKGAESKKTAAKSAPKKTASGD